MRIHVIASFIFIGSLVLASPKLAALV